MSQDISDKQSTNYNFSDFTLPFEKGFVCAKIVGETEPVVLAATEICSDILQIKEALIKKTPIAFTNIGGQKKYAYIIVYGTDLRATRYQLTFKPEVDLNLTPNLPAGADSLSESSDLHEQPSSQILQDQNPLLVQILEKINALEKKVDSLIKMRDQNVNHQDSELAVSFDRYSFKDKFQELLSRCRLSKKWVKDISESSFQDLTKTQEVQVKKLLISGSDDPGYFIRNLARILFGEETITKTLMGVDGRHLKGIKEGDRSLIFDTQQEILVLNILKKVDPHFFINDSNFEVLVRQKINQLGRDLKKKKKGKPIKGTFNSKLITDFMSPLPVNVNRANSAETMKIRQTVRLSHDEAEPSCSQANANTVQSTLTTITLSSNASYEDNQVNPSGSQVTYQCGPFTAELIKKFF